MVEPKDIDDFRESLKNVQIMVDVEKSLDYYKGFYDAVKLLYERGTK